MLENASVDARRRNIIGADGKPLSIEQSAERIHAEHPKTLRELIEIHLCVGSSTACRNPTPNASLTNATGSSSRGNHERKSPPESDRELRSLELFGQK